MTRHSSSTVTVMGEGSGRSIPRPRPGVVEEVPDTRFLSKVQKFINFFFRFKELCLVIYSKSKDTDFQHDLCRCRDMINTVSGMSGVSVVTNEGPTDTFVDGWRLCLLGQGRPDFFGVKSTTTPRTLFVSGSV